MLEAFTPTPRKFYIYLPMVCGAGGALFMALVSFASYNPLDVSGALALAGGIGGAVPALLVGANAVCAERAAWFSYLAAREAAKAQPAQPFGDPADDVRLKVTRAGNIRTSNGFHVIPNLNDEPKGAAKFETASRVYNHAMEVVAHADVDGDLDGTPARLLVDVTRSMWTMAHHVQRMDWRLGEKRWTEGANHPFSPGEFRELLEIMEGQQLIERPVGRGNVAPKFTRAGLNIMHYYQRLPHPPATKAVAVR